MNKYEQIKTGLLIGLVCLSLVLTWQLWTFQSNVALLDESAQYIPSEAMSEEKKLSDVVSPEQIIVFKDEKYGAVLPHQYKFQMFNEQLLTIGIDDEYFETAIVSSNVTTENRVEFIYPTSIPLDVFLTMFQIDYSELVIPLIEVSHVYLYKNEQESAVHLQFIDSNEKKVVDIRTMLPVEDFERVFFTQFSELTKVGKIRYGSVQKEFPPYLYVPEQSVVANRLSFTVSTISGEFFRQTLFPDPDMVKYYRQSDNEESYTDGSRIINIRTNGLFMEYNNPVFSSEQRERSSKHIIQRSYEFINSHGGWTDNYVLADWEANEYRDIAEYRLHINRYPVISFEGSDQMLLRVSRSGNQTEGYIRPLFYLDSQPIDAVDEIELPSREELLDYLEQHNYLDPKRLKKIVLGYEMIMPSRSFVTVEPNWFILFDDRWQKLHVEQEGGENDGLE